MTMATMYATMLGELPDGLPHLDARLGGEPGSPSTAGCVQGTFDTSDEAR
jgi:hypothetical protein